MTIALVLDTNVLRQEGLNSRNMQLLARLVASDEISLFIPEIVAREFKSQRVLEVLEQSTKAQGAIVEMSRQVEAKQESHKRALALKEAIVKLEEALSKDVDVDFMRWSELCGATLLTLSPEALAPVLNDYFIGSGAFRQPKHRDDIPDAFLSAEIRPLLQAYGVVTIAVKDGALKRHLQKEPNYTLVDGLKQFFELEAVRNLTERLDAEEANVAAFKALFSEIKVHELLTLSLRNATEMMERVYLEEGDLAGLDVLGMNLFGASLNFAMADAITEVEYGDVTYIELGRFSIEVMIHTKAAIHFCADYGALQDVAASRQIEQTSMNGDGICDLVESRDVTLKGYLEIEFDPKWGPKEVEIHAQYLDGPKPNISMTLEVTQAAVS